MIDPTVLPAFLLATLWWSSPPGPTTPTSRPSRWRRAPRSGVLSAAGMALGMVVHVTAAALGLALLLRSTPWALETIRIAGAGYLCWLAWSTLRSRDGPGRPSPATLSRPGPAPTSRPDQPHQPEGDPVLRCLPAAVRPPWPRPDGRSAVRPRPDLPGRRLVSDSIIGVSLGRLGAKGRDAGRLAPVLSIAAALTFAGLAAVMILEALQPLAQ